MRSLIRFMLRRARRRGDPIPAGTVCDLGPFEPVADPNVVLFDHLCEVLDPARREAFLALRPVPVDPPITVAAGRLRSGVRDPQVTCMIRFGRGVTLVALSTGDVHLVNDRVSGALASQQGRTTDHG